MSNALKSGWKTYRFDKIAQNIAVRANPANATTDIYVGLEHLDSETIHLQKWGHPSDVSGDKLEFKKGDVIFGRRRAYQRKLAVADCDGICSAHAMVLRAKPDVILPEFLPFFIQSDAFMERAISISVGSLSPTVNWKTLAVQEFSLPPPDEQERMAEILWAADRAVESFSSAEKILNKVIESHIHYFLNQKWPQYKLGQLLENIQYGSSKKIFTTQLHDYVPILRIPNIIGGTASLKDIGYTSLSSAEKEKYKLISGDVLIVRTNGNPDYVGRTAIIKTVPEGCVFASYLIRLSANRNLLDPDFLNIIMSSKIMRKSLNCEIRSSAGNYNLNTVGIKKQLIPLPPIKEQQKFVIFISSLKSRLSLIESHELTLVSFCKSYIQNLGAAHV